ncbi:MAG TPA: hypothetical protein VGC92_05905 [Phenylobacterium sp.]|jgi:hypothetical protein
MTDQNAIRDDIAFLRALAEQGQRGSLVGGSILFAAGLIFGAASLTLWWTLSHGAAWDGWAQWVWPAAAVLFFIYLGLAKAKQRRDGLVRSPAGRMAGVAWSALGCGMFTIIVSLLVIANRTQDWRPAAAIGPVVLALYGVGWFVAAAAIASRWLAVLAAGSFIMGLVTAWFAAEGSATQFLVYGLSILALAGAPGFVLMRRASRAA